MTTRRFSTVAAVFRHDRLRGFAAGFISVLVFHQGAWAILNAFGAFPPPFPYQATQPFGVPLIWSYAFWGGVWGLLYGAVRQHFTVGYLSFTVAFLLRAVVVDLL